MQYKKENTSTKEPSPTLHLPLTKNNNPHTTITILPPRPKPTIIYNITVFDYEKSPTGEMSTITELKKHKTVSFTNEQKAREYMEQSVKKVFHERICSNYNKDNDGGGIKQEHHNKRKGKYYYLNHPDAFTYHHKSNEEWGDVFFDKVVLDDPKLTEE